MQFFRKYIDTFLFYLHSGIIVSGLFLGFFYPLGIVLSIVLLHRVHIILCNGCLFSKLQEKLGVLSKDADFLQVLMLRLFNRKMDPKGVHRLSYALSSFPVLVSIAL